MPRDPTALPARFWVVPHAARTRGEPTVRPLLSQALDCDPTAVPLVRDAGGRPRLGAPFAHLDIGWSHSGEVLVLALALGTGEPVELGVDVERLRERPRLVEMAQRFFHPDETSWLIAQPAAATVECFSRLWCAKEAVLKAHGRGIAFGLHRLVFAPIDGALHMTACDPGLGVAEDWSLHEWAPQAGYRAALAWRAVPAAAAGRY